MKTTHPAFNQIATGKTPPPFSLRLSFEERAKLEEAANGLSLGAYIKAKLFDSDLPKVRGAVNTGTPPVHPETEEEIKHLSSPSAGSKASWGWKVSRAPSSSMRRKVAGTPMPSAAGSTARR